MIFGGDGQAFPKLPKEQIHGVLGGLFPLENLSRHMLFSLSFARQKVFPLVSVFIDPTKWWKVEEIIPKSIGEEKHGCVYGFEYY